MGAIKYIIEVSPEGACTSPFNFQEHISSVPLCLTSYCKWYYCCLNVWFEVGNEPMILFFFLGERDCSIRSKLLIIRCLFVKWAQSYYPLHPFHSSYVIVDYSIQIYHPFLLFLNVQLFKCNIEQPASGSIHTLSFMNQRKHQLKFFRKSWPYISINNPISPFISGKIDLTSPNDPDFSFLAPTNPRSLE